MTDSFELTTLDSYVDEELLYFIITDKGLNLTFDRSSVWGNIYVSYRNRSIREFRTLTADHLRKEWTAKERQNAPDMNSLLIGDHIEAFVYDPKAKELMMKFIISAKGVISRTFCFKLLDSSSSAIPENWVRKIPNVRLEKYEHVNLLRLHKLTRNQIA